MDCPRCFNNVSTKSGIAKCKPRSKCKSCNYRYTIAYKSTTRPPETRRLALKMYLEDMGFRQIGRILDISYNIFRWIVMRQIIGGVMRNLYLQKSIHKAKKRHIQ